MNYRRISVEIKDCACASLRRIKPASSFSSMMYPPHVLKSIYLWKELAFRDHHTIDSSHRAVLPSDK
jgi:hypothetical protein